MEYANELFTELLTIVPVGSSMVKRYATMRRVMDRVIKERTADDKIEYCGLIPRLYALCQRYHVNRHPLCVLWNNTLRVAQRRYEPTEEDFRYDLKALCMGIVNFYGVTLPASLAILLPDHWRTWEHAPLQESQRMRVVVQEWNDNEIQIIDIEDESQSTQIVEYDNNVWHLAEQLYPQAQLNLLSVHLNEAGHLVPQFIILEPDYLVDITSICKCFQQCGTTPLHYLRSKLERDEGSLAIQLGNVANQFLDDAVNQNHDYLQSLQQSFTDDALKYCTLDGVDADFFKSCKQHYDNLQQTVETLFPEAGINVQKDEVQLEPSFLCEALGLQGRMDLLTGDLSQIIELKSGKADEYRGTYNLQHALQMALYKEILHYGLGKRREDVKTLLLYSKYPKIFDIRLNGSMVANALAVRNGIVDIERKLRSNDCLDYLLSLKESDFNTLGVDNNFYKSYIQPGILRFLTKLSQATTLQKKYIATMLSFMEREQFLSKVGDERPDSDNGFSQTWLSDLTSKRQRGSIVYGLTIQRLTSINALISHISMAIPETDTEDSTECYEYQPNFREGEMVTLYERNNETDSIVNRQTIRCYIEEMHPDHLLLRLCHPQRNISFLHKGSQYAIEPAHMDAGYGTAYRGIFSLLSCTQQRRDLILAQRKPMIDNSVALTTRIENPAIAHIVEQAMQAQDYYLLVGPPGTGKTSVALKNMVRELLCSLPTANILLMAYTNRAVDEICEMLEHMPEPVEFLRIGQELSCAPQYRQRLLRNATADCKSRQEMLAYLTPIRVFCGTITTLCSTPELFKLKQFHTAIVDEASQVLEPQLMPLLTATTIANGNPTEAIGRFIFIGDHKQLPAVVVQSPEISKVDDEELRAIGITDTRCSLFERLHRNLQMFQMPELCGFLSHQGRMHEDISRFVNDTYYNGLLDIVPLPHQQGILQWQLSEDATPLARLLTTSRMLAFDIKPISGEDNNKANKAEAEMAKEIVEAIYQLHNASNEVWQPEKSIGIIVPFRSQIALIRHQLEKACIPDYQQITIDTVERYQGSQRDVIIFSTVIRQRYQLDILSAPVDVEGDNAIDRKLNVAVTRARKQFVIVGNLKLLRLSPDYARLLPYCTTAVL